MYYKTSKADLGPIALTQRFFNVAVGADLRNDSHQLLHSKVRYSFLQNTLSSSTNS